MSEIQDLIRTHFSESLELLEKVLFNETLDDFDCWGEAADATELLMKSRFKLIASPTMQQFLKDHDLPTGVQ